MKPRWFRLRFSFPPFSNMKYFSLCPCSIKFPSIFAYEIVIAKIFGESAWEGILVSFLNFLLTQNSKFLLKRSFLVSSLAKVGSFSKIFSKTKKPLAFTLTMSIYRGISTLKMSVREKKTSKPLLLRPFL